MELQDGDKRSNLAILSIEGNKRSRTNTYLSGEIAKTFELLHIKVPRLRNTRRFLYSIQGIPDNAKVLIASPNAILTIPLTLLRRRRPMLDAGWPLIDGVVSSRRQYGFLGLRVLMTYVIDFLAFQLSSVVLLESEEQLDYVRKRFWVRKAKLRVMYTGFDESRHKGSHKQENLISQNGEVKRVLFRGGNQPEAGLDTLSDSVTLLGNSKSIEFTIISKGFKAISLDQSNLRVLNLELNDEELFAEIEASHVMLGQLSNHPRLTRTIPHKFFEAAFFGIPYVTSTSGIMKFFVTNRMVFGFEGGNPYSLIDVLNETLADSGEMKRRASLLSEWYLENASQKTLTNKLLEVLKSD